ncbi:hypothetical protein JR316_0008678 [Psilocybe cubensis]|uniref:Uncharacterized protein n=1 Tax=Psilocybe cubensis TaxID=181762 RepID=A0ACB8GR71_PSICU|nr:hypothetical protein JR316_0008678 [Psilocybe cubensis]KAH9478225.1 hypothetical protein JR316_0008678 [Psilocybe cubensis]
MLSLLQNISTRIQHEQRAIDARNYSSFAALAVLVLDHVLSCRSEYKYIWQAKFRLPQFLYLISRYWALSLQIMHYTFVQKYLIHGPVSSSLCKIWFSLLGSGCIMMGVCMNLILLLRLYALYMKDSKILALALPLIGQHVVALVVVGRAVFKDDAFSDTCDLYHTPIEALPLGILTIVSQAAVWLAAFKKRKIAQAAVLSLVVRESHWTLAVFGVLAAIMIPYSFATQSVNPFIIFVWPTTFISMTTCTQYAQAQIFKRSKGVGHRVYLFNHHQLNRELLSFDARLP